MSRKTSPITRKLTYFDPQGKQVTKKLPKLVKTKCCEKYRKGEKKRCTKCPCMDLIQQVA